MAIRLLASQKIFSLHLLDSGGLEVRGDGAGPAVPVDLHGGGAGGHGRHHPAGAHPLRRPGPHRHAVLQDRARPLLQQGPHVLDQRTQHLTTCLRLG